MSALSHPPPPCTAGQAALARPPCCPPGPPRPHRGEGPSQTRGGQPEHRNCAALRGARPRARSHRPGQRGGPRAAAGPGREGLRAARAPPEAEGRACREAGISAVVLLEKLLPAEGGVTRAAPAGWGRGDRPAPHLPPGPAGRAGRSPESGQHPPGSGSGAGLRPLRQPTRGSLPALPGHGAWLTPAAGRVPPRHPRCRPCPRLWRPGQGRPRPAQGPGLPAAARPGALPTVSRASAPWGTTSSGPQRWHSQLNLASHWPAPPALLQAVPLHRVGVAVPTGCLPTGSLGVCSGLRLVWTPRVRAATGAHPKDPGPNTPTAPLHQGSGGLGLAERAAPVSRCHRHPQRSLALAASWHSTLEAWLCPWEAEPGTQHVPALPGISPRFPTVGNHLAPQLLPLQG